MLGDCPVAVFGISRLFEALDRLCPGLAAQKGGEEGGGSGGVAVVVEVEVVIRLARKAGKGVDGAGGQGV